MSTVNNLIKGDKYHGRISVKGKSDKELRRELEKGYYFMQSKSSSSEGRQQILDAVRAATGEELTRNQIERMWKIIDRMDKMYKLGDLPEFGSLGSNTVRNAVAKQVAKNHTVEYVMKRAEKILRDAYKEEQETE